MIGQAATLAREPDEVRQFLSGQTGHLDCDFRNVRRVSSRSGAWPVDENRSLTVGSATAGGNTVPTSFYGQLVEHMVAASGIRQTNATILTTPNGDSLSVPKTTAHSTASIIAEGATITASDPTFGSVTLGGYKYGFSVQVSTELLEALVEPVEVAHRGTVDGVLGGGQVTVLVLCAVEQLLGLGDHLPALVLQTLDLVFGGHSGTSRFIAARARRTGGIPGAGWAAGWRSGEATTARLIASGEVASAGPTPFETTGAA
jgi:hypothetical protein